jgi:hypothetical protein
MRLKRIVMIALIISGGGLALLLTVGLLVPHSVLVKLSHAPTAVSSSIGGSEANKSKAGNASNTGANAAVGSGPSNTTPDSSTVSDPTKSGAGNTTTGSSNTSGAAGNTNSGATGSSGSTGTSTPPTAIANFTASPSSVAYNASSTLAWSSANASSCSIAPGLGTVATNGNTSTGNLTSSITYTLTCSGNGTVSRQASVTVGAAPVTCGQAGGACSPAQVATHNSAGDCWMIYGGKWYVVTSYVSTHPGGRSVFNSSTCGVDVTNYLNGSASSAGQRHTHSQTAYATLQSFTGGPVR